MTLIFSLFMGLAQADGMGCQTLYTGCMAGVQTNDNRIYNQREQFCFSQQQQCQVQINNGTRDPNAVQIPEDDHQE